MLSARARPAAWLALVLSVVFLSFAAAAPTAGADGPGDRVTAKILRGHPDRRADTRWVTALLEKGGGRREDRQFCGGSLVAERYVLTAAHCVVAPVGGVTPAEDLETLTGTSNLNHGGTVSDVERIYVYPRYNRRTSYGDMALLRLAAPVDVRPIPLAEAGSRPLDALAYVAGWGDRKPYDSSFAYFPTIRFSARIPIAANSKCRRGGGPAFDPDYDRRVMICAGYDKGRPDTCSGDSGGPLARRSESGWRLLGVTSYGNPGCGSRGTYGVYSWVGSRILHRWLEYRLAR